MLLNWNANVMEIRAMRMELVAKRVAYHATVKIQSRVLSVGKILLATIHIKSVLSHVRKKLMRYLFSLVKFLIHRYLRMDLILNFSIWDIDA